MREGSGENWLVNPEHSLIYYTIIEHDCAGMEQVWGEATKLVPDRLYKYI